MITSLLPGRVRLRVPVNENWRITPGLENKLINETGILSAKVNPRSGSVLIEFDAVRTTVDRIERIINRNVEISLGPVSDFKVKSTGKPAGRKRAGAKTYNLLLASLLTSLSGIVFDNKKLHIRAGYLFVTLAGRHVFDFRNRIWRK